MSTMLGTEYKIRIAQVGVGRRARFHLPVIAALHEVIELTAICDRDSKVCESIAAQYGVPGYTSIRELLEKEELDAVSITVPAPAHHAIACLAAAAGVHVITETPIASTRPLADLMIKTCEKHRVKLEVAENKYRMPEERFWSRVIDTGVIGPVSRLWRIFQEGGYHGMSLLRLRAGSDPTRILGIRHETPVVPIVDRVKRHHVSENMQLGYIDFASGVVAVMAYSNVIHARSLGRKQTSIYQVDGQAGAIVDNTLYLVPEAELNSGAVGQPFTPIKHTHRLGEVEVVDAIELALPQPYGTISWENPFRDYPIRESNGVDIADELMSLARAIHTGEPPEYGAAAGRMDQEMNLAMSQSAASNRTTLDLPLPDTTDTEDQIHARFEREYGCDPFDVEKLADVMFPRT